MAARSDNAGVWFPPPLAYALVVVIGILLDRRWSWPVVAGPMSRICGVLCVVGGMALALASVGRFRRSNTSIVPIRPAGRPPRK
jgi:ascorbate-specific PTS system EIIC-type component UlaA